MRKLLISAVLSTLLAACGDREPEVPAVDIEAGRAVVQANCTGCHSLEGAGKTAEIPNLAAQPADYLVEAMHAYRKGDRHHAAALHNNLADFYHDLGDEEQAMVHLKRAVTLFAAIGAATAKALDAAGLTPTLTPARMDSEGLLALPALVGVGRDRQALGQRQDGGGRIAQLRPVAVVPAGDHDHDAQDVFGSQDRAHPQAAAETELVLTGHDHFLG